jgi:hypothetical protein
MVDTSGVLAQPLLLKTSNSLAQVFCVVYGHLKLSGLIHNRLEIAETGDGSADLSIEDGYVLSSAPKQQGRFDRARCSWFRRSRPPWMLPVHMA